MANVADAILAGDFGLDVLLANDPRDASRDLAHRERLTGADVVHIASSSLDLQGETAGARDVVYAHEIAALLAVLENRGGMLVEKTRGEDRQHTSIWIGERLTRPVDIEEAQCHRRNAVRASDHQ